MTDREKEELENCFEDLKKWILEIGLCECHTVLNKECFFAEILRLIGKFYTLRLALHRPDIGEYINLVNPISKEEAQQIYLHREGECIADIIILGMARAMLLNIELNANDLLYGECDYESDYSGSLFASVAQNMVDRPDEAVKTIFSREKDKSLLFKKIMCRRENINFLLEKTKIQLSPSMMYPIAIDLLLVR